MITKTKLAKIFLLALLLVNQIACQDDNNVKDYWKLDEPTVNIREEGESKDSKTIKEKISSFNKNKSLNITQVAYGSNIHFDNIGTDVRFDIESTCQKGELKFKGFYPNQKIYNTIYLYNFLPIEAIVDRTDISDSELTCAYNFIAINKIGSQHSFSLNELSYSTNASNGLALFSRDKEALKINFLKENNNDGYINPSYIDFSEGTSLAYFSRVSFMDSFAMKEPKIYCDITNADLKISEMRTTSTDLSINEYIKYIMPNFTGALLRKCRILSDVVPNVSTKDHIEDYPKVWSPYFDILFKKPTLKVDLAMDYNPGSYPKLNSSSSDYIIAKLKITNTGALPIVVALPYLQTSNAQLEAMVFAASTKFQSPLDNGWSRVKKHTNDLNNLYSPEKVPDSIIESKISSMVSLKYEKDLSSEAYFGVGESKFVNIILSKNFSCLFKNKYSESGFYIQGIKSKSESDKLKILVQDHNGSAVIPIDYYLSDLITSESAINPLSGKEYLIDTVVIPYFANLKVKDTVDYGQNYVKLLESRVPQEFGKPGYSQYIRKLKQAKVRGFEKHCSVFE